MNALQESEIIRRIKAHVSGTAQAMEVTRIKIPLTYEQIETIDRLVKFYKGESGEQSIT